MHSAGGQSPATYQLHTQLTVGAKNRRCRWQRLFGFVVELAQLGEVLDGADHLAGVGVLVVVPGNDLNLGVAVRQGQNHGLRCIEQGTEAHTDDVGGDDLVGVVAEGPRYRRLPRARMAAGRNRRA